MVVGDTSCVDGLLLLFFFVVVGVVVLVVGPVGCC